VKSLHDKASAAHINLDSIMTAMKNDEPDDDFETMQTLLKKPIFIRH